MKTKLLFLLAVLIPAACDPVHKPEPPEVPESTKGVYILNEGQWGENNAGLTLFDFESESLVEDLYSTVNGTRLGDVGNDIIITDQYIIITVNGSNIIQFCDLDGRAVAQTEDVPGCRRMAADKDGKYLYVTSHANDGEVVKLDLKTFKAVGRVKVGYEPEGIVCHGGRLYVANTGGNAFLGEHDYEETISVIDAATMTETKRIKTGHFNLAGAFIQNDRQPRYILVNASGDYGTKPAESFIFDCDTDTIVAEYDWPATYAASHGDAFYSIGSAFDYGSYSYTYHFKTIDLGSGSAVVTDGIISPSVTSAIEAMTAPYGLYLDRDGNIYATDASDYKNRGLLYRFTPEGVFLEKHIVGVCPGHFASR